jgi:hypothetical protein
MSEVGVTASQAKDGKIYVTLKYVRVGSEHNHDEEIFLDEFEARELLAALQWELVPALNQGPQDEQPPAVTR